MRFKKLLACKAYLYWLLAREIMACCFESLVCIAALFSTGMKIRNQSEREKHRKKECGEYPEYQIQWGSYSHEVAKVIKAHSINHGICLVAHGGHEA